MGILVNEYSDEVERKATIKLIKDYDKGINNQINRLYKIEKELEEGDITTSRLQELILATKLISKDLDYKCYTARAVVSGNIENIYTATFNTEEKQLKQSVVELKRCSKLIQEYHSIYIQQSWGSMKYRRRCKEQGQKSDLLIEGLLDIKQQVKLKHIEFKLVKERQVLIEERAYLIGIAKELDELVDKDIEIRLREILNNLCLSAVSLHINKKKQDKEVIGQAYKHLYQIIEEIERGFKYV